MRLFSSQRDDSAAQADEVINLLWRYEISEDGGKSWRPETERDEQDSYVLRRGNWVVPSLN